MDLKKLILDKLAEKMSKSIDVFHRECGSIRTGRASIGLVEHIKVNCYDSSLPLKQIASISTPDARTIVIQPWDVHIISDIEKAILKENIGLVPNNDGKVIRINVPPLTTERRQEMVKLARNIAEDSRVSIRAIRREGNDRLKDLQKQGEITEDQLHKGIEEVQRLTTRYIDQIDSLLKKKEGEITIP